MSERIGAISVCSSFKMREVRPSGIHQNRKLHFQTRKQYYDIIKYRLFKSADVVIHD